MKTMTLEDLQKQLEIARKKLNTIWMEKNQTTDAEVLRVAEEFDLLLNEYRLRANTRFL